MSDEDANYDDFMMSDEDDMGVIEMEEESSAEEQDVSRNDDAEVSDAGLFHKQKEVSNESFEMRFEMAKSYEDDQDFEKARQLYGEIFKSATGDSQSVEWGFKAIVEILRSWSTETHYSSISESICETIISDFNIFIQFLNSNFTSLKNDILQKACASLLDDLFPILNREFLFAIEMTDQHSLLLKMQLQMKCLDMLEKHLTNKTILQESVQFRRIAAKIWHERLSIGTIERENVCKLQTSCDNGDEKFRVDKICLILQCYIYNFVNSGTLDSEETLIKYVKELKEITSNSIGASQRLGLMIQLHLSRAITILVNCNAKENGVEVPKFYEKVQDLRKEFWECLQHIEEIGGSKQNFTSNYEKFILAGFTFTNVILYSADENKINPFDFEQMKIAHKVPIVQVLQNIYQHFVNLNLSSLYDAIQLLGNLQSRFKGLVETVYHLSQLIKLWTKIAPVYSCISLQDIQKLLQLNKSRRLTRDGLLTILMKSITNDDADVLYKLDLTKDLVYFGDENRVQLSMYPKGSFKLNKSGILDLEFANNVTIFDNPEQLKRLTTSEFFDRLQSSRDNVHSINHEPLPNTAATVTESLSPQQGTGFQPTHIRYSNKYNELSELIQYSLNL